MRLRSPAGSPLTRLLRQTLVIALTMHVAWSAAQTSTDPGGTQEETTTDTQSRLRGAPQGANTELRDSSRLESEQRGTTDRNGRRSDDRQRTQQPTVRPPRYQPGAFELFVRRLANQDPRDENGLRRFGSELITAAEPMRGGDAPLDQSPSVPGDYLVAPGDELVVTLWGSVNADLRLAVDRSGRISIPRVGSVMVAGVRYADLAGVLRQRVAQVFRNFDLSVSLGQLRSIRIYVTGFTARPGAYAVSSLSTIVNALMAAGGPSSAGSFRKVELRRGGTLVTTFDLYDLLLKGDKSSDRTLQAEDVVHIGPIGAQVALIGSVNKPAIFELKPNETLADLVQMAGGLTAVADRSRMAIERLEDRGATRITQLELPAALSQPVRSGDVVRAFSVVDAALPIERQNKRVRVEGEVLRPGEFILPPGSTTADALRAAGGLTPIAYVYGTEFNRESVRLTQQENYERALRDLETEFARATSTQRALTADEATAQAVRGTATERLVQRLRAIKPTGRIVLQLDPQTRELPPLVLEDGDRLYIPAVPSTVGVFGSVFNGGSYLYTSGRSLEDYLRLAGGPTRGADTGSVFVVRANGSVESSRQHGTWFGRGSVGNVGANPGDTVFVPEEMDKTTFTQSAKEWTQILYQFGLGAAALVTLRNN